MHQKYHVRTVHELQGVTDGQTQGERDGKSDILSWVNPPKNQKIKNQTAGYSKQSGTLT